MMSLCFMTGDNFYHLAKMVSAFIYSFHYGLSVQICPVGPPPPFMLTPVSFCYVPIIL